MNKIGILASGNGSNFQNIVEALEGTQTSVAVLISDKKEAFVLERAFNLGVPSYFVPYISKSRNDSEAAISDILSSHSVDIVVLAGFMRILSPFFIKKWEGKILNIHPSLLPKYPGAHGIRDSFNSQDEILGVTVHLVDEGLDSGSILGQASFVRPDGLTFEEAEKRIHELEFALYPQIILDFLELKENSPQ